MTELPEAVPVRNGLLEAAKEFEKFMPKRNKELNEIDANNCREGARLIQKYDTEVFRLRQSILCYCDGRLDRHELRKIARSWNNDQ